MKVGDRVRLRSVYPWMMMGGDDLPILGEVIKLATLWGTQVADVLLNEPDDGVKIRSFRVSEIETV